MLARLTRSSELARIAAEAANGDTMSVRFSVLHAPTGPHLDLLRSEAERHDGAAQDPEISLSNFSLFSAAGMSMCAATWPSSTSAFGGTVRIDDPRELKDEPEATSYSGLTVPNPGFLNESTRRVDVMITLGSTHWSPSYRDCLMNSLIAEKLSDLAMTLARGPVLYMHTPVSPFQEQHVSERGDGSGERLRDALGPCIRMSVGLDPHDSSARLDFEAGVARLAEEYGLGLRLDDRRFNRVRGEWFTIRGFDRERYRTERNRRFPRASTQLPKQALIATVIGPARVGVTSLVTRSLNSRGIGVLGVSVSSMQRIAFLNFVIPISETAGPAEKARTGDWDQAMAVLTSQCAQSPGTADAVDRSLVADYKFAISRPARCSYPASSRRTGASLSGRVPHPLWVAWEIPHRALDTPALLAEICTSLAPFTTHCEVAYSQSRLLRGDVVRGRGKLIVVLTENHRDNVEAQGVLAEAAERAQEQTLVRLTAAQRIQPGRARLRLSSRERWLAYGGIFS